MSTMTVMFVSVCLCMYLLVNGLIMWPVYVDKMKEFLQTQFDLPVKSFIVFLQSGLTRRHMKLPTRLQVVL